MARRVEESDSQLKSVDLGTPSFLEMEPRLQPLARKVMKAFRWIGGWLDLWMSGGWEDSGWVSGLVDCWINGREDACGWMGGGASGGIGGWMDSWIGE